MKVVSIILTFFLTSSLSDSLDVTERKNVAHRRAKRTMFYRKNTLLPPPQPVMDYILLPKYYPLINMHAYESSKSNLNLGTGYVNADDYAEGIYPADDVLSKISELLKPLITDNGRRTRAKTPPYNEWINLKHNSLPETTRHREIDHNRYPVNILNTEAPIITIKQIKEIEKNITIPKLQNKWYEPEKEEAIDITVSPLTNVDDDLYKEPTNNSVKDNKKTNIELKSDIESSNTTVNDDKKGTLDKNNSHNVDGDETSVKKTIESKDEIVNDGDSNNNIREVVKTEVAKQLALILELLTIATNGISHNADRNDSYIDNVMENGKESLNATVNDKKESTTDKESSREDDGVEITDEKNFENEEENIDDGDTSTEPTTPRETQEPAATEQTQSDNVASSSKNDQDKIFNGTVVAGNRKDDPFEKSNDLKEHVKSEVAKQLDLILELLTIDLNTDSVKRNDSKINNLTETVKDSLNTTINDYDEDKMDEENSHEDEVSDEKNVESEDVNVDDGVSSTQTTPTQKSKESIPTKQLLAKQLALLLELLTTDRKGKSNNVIEISKERNEEKKHFTNFFVFNPNKDEQTPKTM